MYLDIIKIGLVLIALKMIKNLTKINQYSLNTTNIAPSLFNSWDNNAIEYLPPLSVHDSMLWSNKSVSWFRKFLRRPNINHSFFITFFTSIFLEAVF